MGELSANSVKELSKTVFNAVTVKTGFISAAETSRSKNEREIIGDAVNAS